jgi:hypothetical protein
MNEAPRQRSSLFELLAVAVVVAGLVLYGPALTGQRGGTACPDGQCPPGGKCCPNCPCGPEARPAKPAERSGYSPYLMPDGTYWRYKDGVVVGRWNPRTSVYESWNATLSRWEPGAPPIGDVPPSGGKS